jgi:membrane associated rhomboid family serine protease
VQPIPPPPGGTNPGYGFAGCYRHPDRLTGVRCVRCNRPICPECQRSASVGFQCPDDVAAGAASVRQPRTVLGAGVSAATPIVTYVLIGLNVLTYLATSLGQGGSFVSSQGRLFYDWETVPVLIESNHEYYRLLTGAFLHVSPLHIILNMWALYIVGIALEPVMGRWRYLSAYLLSALGGSVAVLVFGAPDGAVAGASGAIFGLFGAALVLSKFVGVFAFRPLMITVVVNFVFTFSIAGISKLGHIGGFLTGLVVMVALLGWTLPPSKTQKWTTSARSVRGQVISLSAMLAFLVAVSLLKGS